MRYAERTSRRLSRAIFHAMVRLGPKLERRQMVLFRAVDIGAELFAISATCSRAHMLAKKQGRTEALELADLFCREARERIAQHFRDFFGPNDAQLYTVSLRVLKGEHAWLEGGIVGMVPAAPKAPGIEGSGGRGVDGKERRGDKAAALIG
jgi:hypothetical protein